MATARLPAGLTFSMFVAAVSLVVMTVFWNLGSPAGQGPSLIAHAGASLCLFWILAAWLVAKCRPGLAGTAAGVDLLAVLRVGSMATGLAATIVMLYGAMVEIIFRTLLFYYELTPQLQIWRTGLIDLGAIACAMVLAYRQTRNPDLMTALFWLLIFAGLWGAFQMPAFRQESAAGINRSDATPWASLFALNSAVVITALTIARGVTHRRRRREAWPGNLAALTEPPPRWPGFRYSAGMMAVVVLILGCMHIIVPWTSLAVLLAGGSMLALTHRRWNENLADAGLALITLGVVSLTAITFSPPQSWTPAALAELFNRILIGLAIMVGFWYWLAGVWKQQLDDGQAWTTTGRLIRTSHRVGYLVGALAVLMSLELSFWPKFPYVYDLDDTTWRWAWGLTANALLLLALVFAAQCTGRPTQAWLALFTVASVVMFVVVRSPHSVIGQVWSLFWPLLMAMVAPVALLLAGLAGGSSRWRAFWEPLYLTGLLIAPMAAIAGASFTEPASMPQWVPAATFGYLALVYLIATVFPGPRSFVAVAIVCAVMAIWDLRLTTGSTSIDRAFFYPMLCGMSLALVAAVLGLRRPAGIFRVLKWAGGVLAIVALTAGMIASSL